MKSSKYENSAMDMAMDKKMMKKSTMPKMNYGSGGMDKMAEKKVVKKTVMKKSGRGR